MKHMLQRQLAQVRGRLEGFLCPFAPAAMSANMKFGKFVDLWQQEILPQVKSSMETLKSEGPEGG